jgi:hypothetical protein
VKILAPKRAATTLSLLRSSGANQGAPGTIRHLPNGPQLFRKQCVHVLHLHS